MSTMISWEVWILLITLLFRVTFAYEELYVLETKNIALNKPTRQSSTLGQNSSFAVNGNYDDFSQTEAGYFNWWAVDLEKKEKIVSIKAHNRKDCCQERLSNVSIWTSVQLQPGIPSVTNSRWTKQFFREEFSKKFIIKAFNSEIEARHVAITTESTNETLNLAEVEIYGAMETTNVARAKPATHGGNSSSSPSIVNNGMIDDCSEMIGNEKWWQVDLEALYSLSYVVIYKTTDCTGSSATLIRVSLSKHESVNPPDVSWDLHENNAEGTEHWELRRAVSIDTHSKVGRHVKVETHEAKTLALSEVKIYVGSNLAFRRPTSQSSTYESYGSHLAVNGYYKDFTHTEDVGEKFWEVDLLDIFCIEKITIVNREQFWERIAHLSVLTAKIKGVWSHKSYLTNAVENKHSVDVDDEVQIIRLVSNNSNSPFSLAEIVLTEARIENYQVDQSSTNSSNLPGSSEISKFAVTNFYIDLEQWLKVKLFKMVFMTSMKFWFDDGMCRKSLQDPLVPCTTISGNIYVKTSTDENPPTVTLADNLHWRVCYFQDREPPIQLHISCNRKERHRIIKHLSVQPRFIGHQINLKRLEIYRKSLPQFPGHAQAELIQVTALAFTLNFPSWLPHHIGAFSPTSYSITLEGDARSTSIRYNSEVRIHSFTMGGLTPGMTYNYSITCKFNEFTCPGKVITGTIKLKPSKGTPSSYQGTTNRPILDEFNSNVSTGSPGVPKFGERVQQAIRFFGPGAITCVVVGALIGVSGVIIGVCHATKRDNSKTTNTENDPNAATKVELPE